MCPFEEWRGGGGSLLACNTYGFWCDWASMVLLADLWSTPEAVLFSRSFHLLLDPVYRVSPVSHTKFSVSASTWCRQLYFSLVLGKHFLVKTGICWLSGGSAFSGTWLLLNMHGMNSLNSSRVPCVVCQTLPHGCHMTPLTCYMIGAGKGGMIWHSACLAQSCDFWQLCSCSKHLY